ncbi:CLUMA_CG010174, isoform A [Clunio marinus]|uniref:CLUMA_CG010174, isoform A n=1 Tax=Clunio marinus TaxID=568069 RepID=A0A1J1IDG2_9DIPT|nr:CLUMA_CG010174, isoform A [Clunio marinus]
MNENKSFCENSQCRNTNFLESYAELECLTQYESLLVSRTILTLSKHIALTLQNNSKYHYFRQQRKNDTTEIQNYMRNVDNAFLVEQSSQMMRFKRRKTLQSGTDEK